MNRIRGFGARTLALGGALLIPLAAAGQERQPRAVWEAANYPADIELTDVFFVTPEIGWVSGTAGTILHTNDGGRNWTPQLGGEPEAADEAIGRLRFLDEWHGWAVQRSKLLRTTDGESWEEIGATPEAMGDWGDYAFLSPSYGIALGSSQAIGYPDQILRTRDGGRTWEPVVRCQVKATIDGLTRQVGCVLTRLHFPTPTVGYAIGLEGICPTCALPVIAKTGDGGETWTFAVGPGDVKTATPQELFFTDERTGYVRNREGTADKLYATTDGGATWRGVVAKPGEWLRFADPEVGWSVDQDHLSYTTGGGKWSSQQHRFPAEPNALSFPRRDRAYLVGDHGMVYRYSLLSAGAPAPQGAVLAPAMPAPASALESEAAEIETAVSEVSAALEQAPEENAAADVVGEPSGFADSCCGKPVNKLDVLLGQVVQSLPQFLARFRNTNLLKAGVRMVTILPGGLGELKEAYAQFKQAPDKASAQAALGNLSAAAGSLHQAVRIALQEELPAAEAVTGSESSEEPAAAPAVQATSPDPTAEAVKKEAKSLIKKKLRLP